MRNARRSTRQLTRTSANRARVFEFMERFSARHLYTIDGPQDTDLDEIMAFAYEGGVAVVHTFEGGFPLWTLYTEPSVSGDLDELEKAMRWQVAERDYGPDAPLSSMWVMKMLESLIPRMSDETITRCLHQFEAASAERQTHEWRDRNKDVRIPVEGMTPDGFTEPGPVVGELPSLTPEQMFPKSLASLRAAMYVIPADAPIHFSKKAVVDIAEYIGLEQMTDDNIRSFINKAESILATRHQSDANS